MINKNKFSIKDTKKVLHKIGKRWVVVSAILLGLVAGGTAVAHTSVSADAQGNNHSTQMGVAQRQNSGVASTNIIDKVSNVSSMSQSSLINTSDLNASQASNASSADDSLSMRMGNNPQASSSDNFELASMANFQHVANVVNDDVKPNNKATYSAAVSGFNDLMSMANASNVQRFINGAKLGEDTVSNSDTGTWIGEFNKAKQDIDAINANGKNAKFSALTSTVDSVVGKLHTGIESETPSATSIATVINSGYPGAHLKINSIASNSYTLDTLADLLDNTKTNLNVNGYATIFGTKYPQNFDYLVRQFINSKLVSRLDNDNALNMSTVIRGLNTIINNSSMRNKYQSIINGLSTLSKNNNSVDTNVLNKDAFTLGIKAILKNNPIPSLSSLPNLQDLLNFININNKPKITHSWVGTDTEKSKYGPQYNTLMKTFDTIPENVDFNKGAKFSDVYKTLDSIKNKLDALNNYDVFDTSALKPIYSLLNPVMNIARVVNAAYGNKVIKSSNIADYVIKTRLPAPLASKITMAVGDMAKIESNSAATGAYHNVFDGLNDLTANDSAKQVDALNKISDNLSKVANSLPKDKVNSALNALSLATHIQSFKLKNNVSSITSMLNMSILSSILDNNKGKDSAYYDLMKNQLGGIVGNNKLNFNNGVKFNDFVESVGHINNDVQRLKGTELNSVQSVMNSVYNSVYNLTNTANSVYGNHVIKAGKDASVNGTIAYDVAKANVPQPYADDLITVVNDMAEIQKNNVKDYQDVFSGLADLATENSSDQVSTLNSISDNLLNVSKNIIPDDKVSQSLNKLALGTKMEAFKKQYPTLPAVYSVVNLQDLISIINNKDNIEYTKLMDTLKGAMNLNFNAGAKFSDIYNTLSDVQKSVDLIPQLNSIKPILDKFMNVASLANDIYGDHTIKAGNDANEQGTIAHDLAMVGVPEEQALKVKMAVNDMAQIEAKDPSDYQNVFSNLSQLPGKNSIDQAATLNNVANDLRAVINKAELPNDKINQTLNKLALVANVQAFKLKGNISAISTVININTLMKVIGNLNNRQTYDHLMTTLDSAVNLDFKEGVPFHKINGILQNINYDVQRLNDNSLNDIKGELNSVASIANDASSLYGDRPIKAGSNANDVNTIAYDVSKANVPSTQASDLVSMVDDMANITNNSNVSGVYHHIFEGLKSLPGQNEAYQADKLDAIFKDLLSVPNVLSDKTDKVAKALNSLTDTTESTANSLAAKEINNDASVISDDLSNIQSPASSIDALAINNDKGIIYKAISTVKRIKSDLVYQSMQSAENAASKANNAVYQASALNTLGEDSSSVTSYRNAMPKSNVAPNSVISSDRIKIASNHNIIRDYYNYTKTQSFTPNEISSANDAVTDARSALDNAVKASSFASSGASYADSLIDSNAASSGAQKANQSLEASIKSSAISSADQSIADSYIKSIYASVASANQSKANSAAVVANQEIANSYKDSVSADVKAKDSNARNVAAKSADQSLESSIATSAANSHNNSLESSIANSYAKSADNSIANSYETSVSNSVSKDNSSKAVSAAQAAGQSIANSISASNSANQSETSSIVASNATARFMSEQSSSAASVSAEQQQSLAQASQSASASASMAKQVQQSSFAKSSSASAPKNLANKSTSSVKKARTVQKNVKRNRQVLNKARHALKNAKTKRAKRVAQHQLRKAQAKYNRAKQTMKRINNLPANVMYRADKQVTAHKQGVNKARYVLKHAHGRKAKAVARRALRKAEVQYKVAAKRLTVAHQRAVKSVVNSLARMAKHGNRRARQQARRVLSSLNNEKRAIAKLHRRGHKANHKALRRANAKLVKLENSIIK